MLERTVMALAVGVMMVVGAAPAQAFRSDDWYHGWVDARAQAFTALTAPDGTVAMAGDRPSGYGAAFAADVMLDSALRTGDPARLAAATSAANAVLAGNQNGLRDPFRLLALASYAQRLKTSGHDPQSLAVILTVLGGWERGASSDGPHAPTCYEKPTCYNNWKLIEAAGLAQALTAGAQFDADGEMAGDDAARQRIADIAQMAVKHAGRPSSGGGQVLSDPGPNPPAYHAFSAALMAVIVDNTPDLAGPLHQQLPSSVEYMHGLVAPDGTLAYMGRSQEQIWTYAAGIYACRVASRGQANELSGRCSRLEDLLSARLIIETTLLPNGLAALTPGASLASVDPYAGVVMYNALATHLLTRVVPAGPPMGMQPLPVDLGFESDTTTWSDLGGSGIGWVRYGPVFAAVQAERRGEDPRYDGGLLTVRARTTDGWKALTAGRPLTNRTWAGVQPKISGKWAQLKVKKFKQRRGGLVGIGDWTVAGKRKADATMTVTPTGRGVKVEVRVPGGVPVRWAEFLSGGRKSGSSVSTDLAEVMVIGGGSPDRDKNFPTALASNAERWAWTFEAPRNGLITARIISSKIADTDEP